MPFFLDAAGTLTASDPAAGLAASREAIPFLRRADVGEDNRHHDCRNQSRNAERERDGVCDRLHKEKAATTGGEERVERGLQRLLYGTGLQSTIIVRKHYIY